MANDLARAYLGSSYLVAGCYSHIDKELGFIFNITELDKEEISKLQDTVTWALLKQVHAYPADVSEYEEDGKVFVEEIEDPSNKIIYQIFNHKDQKYLFVENLWDRAKNTIALAAMGLVGEEVVTFDLEEKELYGNADSFFEVMAAPNGYDILNRGSN